MILLGLVVVAIRAEAQVNVLLGVERLEELLAKRAAAAPPDGE